MGKTGKQRKKALWLVQIEKSDGVFERVLLTPEKNKAREVAAKFASQGAKVYVSKVVSSTLIDKEDLRASLPKDAF